MSCDESHWREVTLEAMLALLKSRKDDFPWGTGSPAPMSVEHWAAINLRNIDELLPPFKDVQSEDARIGWKPSYQLKTDLVHQDEHWYELEEDMEAKVLNVPAVPESMKINAIIKPRENLGKGLVGGPSINFLNVTMKTVCMSVDTIRQQVAARGRADDSGDIFFGDRDGEYLDDDNPRKQDAEQPEPGTLPGIAGTVESRPPASQLAPPVASRQFNRAAAAAAREGPAGQPLSRGGTPVSAAMRLQESVQTIGDAASGLLKPYEYTSRTRTTIPRDECLDVLREAQQARPDIMKGHQCEVIASCEIWHTCEGQEAKSLQQFGCTVEYDQNRCDDIASDTDLIATNVYITPRMRSHACCHRRCWEG